MERQLALTGRYVRGFGFASTHWEQICADHQMQFPRIGQCYPGTLNITLDDGSAYAPPEEDKYRPTNYISPRAKVIEINGIALDAWIYRGGHGNEVLELISAGKLSEQISLRIGDPVVIKIVEFSEEGEGDMPKPPQR